MAATIQRADETDHTAVLAGHLLAMSDEQREAWMARLDVEDRAVAADIYERAIAEQQQQGWRATPFTMARHLEGDAFHDYAFSRYLGERFVDAVTGVDPFQIWNMPAQVGKTEIVRRCVAWALDRRPQDPIIYTAYGESLAHNSARFIRDYGITHADALRYRLRADASKVGEWLTTEGGGLKATGIAGGLSGFPAAGLVIDDPHKNWQEAHSEAKRQAVWDLYRSVLRLRLRMGGWIIILHTRWHEDDLTGRVLADALANDERWLHVRLPMIAEIPDPAKGIGPDPLGRAPGDPLEPRRFDKPAAEARARTLGTYLAAALETQRPTPAEGGILKRDWWLIEDQVPAESDQWLTSWDMKMKDVANRGDFIVGQIWSRVGSHYWCHDQLRGQWTLATSKAAIALAQVRFPHIRRHIIENTGNGPEVMEQLEAGDPGWTCSDDLAGLLGIVESEREPLTVLMRRGMSGLVPNNPKGDKRVRTIAVSGLIEGSNVHLKKGTWNEVLVNEAAAFPEASAHDDTVDAMSQALAVLSDIPGTTSVVTAARVTVPQRAAGSGVPARTIPGGARVPGRNGGSPPRLR